MKIVTSNARMRALINKALAKEGEKVLKTASSNIRKKVKEVVRRAIATCPEMRELSSGILKFDFGLTEDPSTAITNSVANSTRVSVSKVSSRGGSFRGGIKITVQPSTFSNLLSLPVAQQAIEDGGSIPWLKWLLTAGDAIIIGEFGVDYEVGTGRTGAATMKKSEKPFKVNPLYSGDEVDNFVTRAIDPTLREISAIVRKELS
tara:strand:+ start:1902 stop:2513 length:612 start_codon:yes stop_codon:yes gene_type:complete